MSGCLGLCLCLFLGRRWCCHDVFVLVFVLVFVFVFVFVFVSFYVFVLVFVTKVKPGGAVEGKLVGAMVLSDVFVFVFVFVFFCVFVFVFFKPGGVVGGRMGGDGVVRMSTGQEVGQ